MKQLLVVAVGELVEEAVKEVVIFRVVQVKVPGPHTPP